MSSHRILDSSRLRRCVLLLCMALAVLLWTSSARAGLLISVESVTAAAGSTGNTLEVDLTNTGTSAVTIGGFSFGISTSTTNILFTQATNNTTNFIYIFAGDSLAGPAGSRIDTSTGQSLIASDSSTLVLSMPPGGTSIGVNETLGLGEVFFNVAPGTSPGPIPVDLTPFPTTSLSDPAGNDLSGPNGSNLSFSNGTILVTPSRSAVPEPSTLLLFSTGLALLAARAFGCRRFRLEVKRQNC